MRGTGEPAVAAATITLAEGRGAAVEAAGKAILAVHDEPCRVSQPIQLTSELPMSGPPRSRAACAHPVSQPEHRLSSRAAKRPPDQVASGAAFPATRRPAAGVEIAQMARSAVPHGQVRMYSPGPWAITGWRLLPIGGGLPIGPECSADQVAQSSHHDPL
jgi:hypothetical protein